MDAFVRQLAWRDFHHQVLAARPQSATDDYRDRGRDWRRDDDALAAWKEGRTGIPIVDAGMRQLLEEGWMHNRARLLTASLLTKTLRVDWRLGARHFFDWLVDGDIANNTMNWQWVAGTGTDTRPNRVLNPLRQAAGSTRPATTYAATSPSWPTSTTPTCTRRGRRASHRPTTRRRSWRWRAAGCDRGSRPAQARASHVRDDHGGG